MEHYKLGVDIGSTTVKLVVLDENNKYKVTKYERHFSNINNTLLNMINDIKDELKDEKLAITLTGSGGFSLSKELNVNFVQEVISVTRAIKKYDDSIDIAIEIGGEDAKIIYFDETVEQRMNGICAGGTGSFIDQMASLMRIDAEKLNELSKNANQIYDVAARCGVFAKSDVQPLINDGVAGEDIAISIFQAVVNQTISGLACGRKITGNVCFLGGPLHFLDQLKARFIETLGLEKDRVFEPENSHLFAAFGAAINPEVNNIMSIDEFYNNLKNVKVKPEINRLPRLFENSDDYNKFLDRHNSANVEKADINTYEGNAYIGIDAGSTTTKIAVITEDGRLLHHFYDSNNAEPLNIISSALVDFYKLIEGKKITVKSSGVTGYGEALVKAALKIDVGEVETVAHYRAASFFNPNVDYILDIGGQDIKAISIYDNYIDSVVLNEACSAGCGSFIETFAMSVNKDVKEFSKIGLYAEDPIDLGTRCTVFMNSRVKQAQKEGAKPEDISAGLAYSVIKNALQKVIKVNDAKNIGKNIVVQGGTFHNDAVLRCFEILTNVNVIRPDIAGIMGAFGVALIAKERVNQTEESTILTKQEIEELNYSQNRSRCGLCLNKCLLTITTFNDNRKFISGNKCEKGLGVSEKENWLPNLFKYKQDRLFHYKPLVGGKRGKIGIPRVLDMYENYPFWYTFLTELEYEVELSPFSSKKIYERGIESIPSESACYPAKIVHGHIGYLIDQGIKSIFYPSVVYGKKEFKKADNHYNCPIVISYSENVKNNTEELKENNVKIINPFLNLNHKKSVIKVLSETFVDIPRKEITAAVNKAYIEQERYVDDVKIEGKKAYEIVKNNNLTGIVLAGKPYHIDPEINHSIDKLVNTLGLACFTEDSILSLIEDTEENLNINVLDQWTYHSRIYRAANVISMLDRLEIVQLNSFGCGLDAISTDEAQEILKKNNKMFTTIKIDEVSNLGPAKIRLRSLLAAINDRQISNRTQIEEEAIPVFKKENKKDYTILCPQMSHIHFELIKEAFISEGYNTVVLPEIDKYASDTGQKYVNNDSCYPALIVVGQVINEINSGKHDINKLGVIITQTGGGCRASNYVALIRKALKSAGYGHIPVISLNASGLEKEGGLKLSFKMLNKVMKSIVYGDLLMKLLYKTRPYELIKGSANNLYLNWLEACQKDIKYGSKRTFKRNIADMIIDFDNLNLVEEEKIRVGIVGEILVKYHPTANNNLLNLLENEGVEVEVPALLDFVLYSVYNQQYASDNLGNSKFSKHVSKFLISIIESYRKSVNESLRLSKRFHQYNTIESIAQAASEVISIGNQTGEGWFLTGEMIKLAQSGTNNIVCVQPFACLPNHIFGKGVIKELRSRYKANVLAVDYDPGASEVNQLNRIKLMLTAAKENLSTSNSTLDLNV